MSPRTNNILRRDLILNYAMLRYPRQFFSRFVLAAFNDILRDATI